jgi:hypothetical protein
MLSAHVANPENLGLQAYLTTIMNCEYQIYRLNAATPLQNNPFLTYWLEAVDTIQEMLAGDLQLEGKEDGQAEEFKQLVAKARLNVIHHALTGPDTVEGVKLWARRHAIYESPQQLIEQIVDMGTARFLDSKSIDLKYYEQFGNFTLSTSSVDRRQNQSQGLSGTEKPLPEISRSRRGSFEAGTVETRRLGSLGHTQANNLTPTLTEDSRLGGSLFSGSPRVGSPLISSPLNDASRSGRSGTDSPLNRILRNGSPRSDDAHFSAAELRDRFASLGETSHRVNVVEHELPTNTEDIVNGSEQVEEHSVVAITSKMPVLSILNHLREPGFAQIVHDLTRLRIDLNSLELLTNILTSPLLAETPVEPGPLVCGYIQHSLRTVERMAWSRSPRSDAAGDNGDDIFSDAVVTGGRDDQARAVKLLVLFLKNLLKRGIVQHQELYFDVEEICVRYIWIPEVREFRKFLEGTDLITKSGLEGVPQGG